MFGVQAYSQDDQGWAEGCKLLEGFDRILLTDLRYLRAYNIVFFHSQHLTHIHRDRPFFKKLLVY